MLDGYLPLLGWHTRVPDLVNSLSKGGQLLVASRHVWPQLDD